MLKMQAETSQKNNVAQTKKSHTDPAHQSLLSQERFYQKGTCHSKNPKEHRGRLRIDRHGLSHRQAHSKRPLCVLQSREQDPLG